MEHREAILMFLTHFHYYLYDAGIQVSALFSMQPKNVSNIMLLGIQNIFNISKALLGCDGTNTQLHGLEEILIVMNLSRRFRSQL